MMIRPILRLSSLHLLSSLRKQTRFLRPLSLSFRLSKCRGMRRRAKKPGRLRGAGSLACGRHQLRRWNCDGRSG